MKETAVSGRRGTLRKAENSVLVPFVLLAVIWGASFLFIKEALNGFAPVQVAAGRISLGAITLVVMMMVTRRKWPRGRIWIHLVVGAIPLCVLPMLLYSWATQHLPSSLESVYNATTPLMTMLIAVLLPSAERLSRARLTGLLVGGAGVLIVLAPWHLIADTGALAGTG
ncbi:MAG TPA: DMT family transporter [Thermomicrobiales bacterium]|nr:DMT family transporter [Thermomicrobiales bacterium]